MCSVLSPAITIYAPKVLKGSAHNTHHMTEMRRIKITHEDYKQLDSEFNADSARNAPAGFLVHSVLEQNAELKQRVKELELLLSRVATMNVSNAKNRNAAWDTLDAAVFELKTM